MRWSSAHVGNIRQAPLEGQEVVNPEMKVPDEQNPLVSDEELEPAPTRRDADPKERDADPSGRPQPAPAKPDPKDAPKAHDAPKDAPSGAKH